jgi:hypothetical protein
MALWAQFLETKTVPLSSEQQEFVSELATSADRFEQLVARAVRMDLASPCLDSLIELLDQECSLGFVDGLVFNRDLLYLQFGFPANALNRPAIKAFIYAAAKSSDTDCRINATHVLAKVASVDPTAESLLIEMKADPDPIVRKNAAIMSDKH